MKNLPSGKSRFQTKRTYLVYHSRPSRSAPRYSVVAAKFAENQAGSRDSGMGEEEEGEDEEDEDDVGGYIRLFLVPILPHIFPELRRRP